MPKIQGATKNQRREILAAAAEELPDEAIECRTLGHAMWPFLCDIDDDQSWNETRRCRRCKVRRNLTFDSAGYLVASSYTYPKDHPYRISGLGHLRAEDNAMLRVEHRRRITPAKRLRSVG